ncbi:hypothetical protein D3C87_2053540 [compost metagenome]
MDCWWSTETKSVAAKNKTSGPTQTSHSILHFAICSATRNSRNISAPPRDIVQNTASANSKASARCFASANAKRKIKKAAR